MAHQFWRIFSRNSICYVAQQHLNRHNGLRYCSVSGALNEDIGDEVERTGSEILQSLQNKGIDASRKSFMSLYHYLHRIGVDTSTLKVQILKTPDLLEYPVANWKGVCDILTKNGVSSDVAFKNISLCPGLLQVDLKILERNVNKYSEMYVGRLPVLYFIQRNPQLYVTPPRTILKRMTLLNNTFPPTELKIVLLNNPNILVDDWNSISEKLLYIHEEMGLDQPQIAVTEALQKSLLHIKIRHQFLLRAGLYKKPNLLRNKNSAKNNPELSMILDTSSKFFVNKIARLTNYEYEVFGHMIKEEHDSLSDDEDEDSDYDATETVS